MHEFLDAHWSRMGMSGYVTSAATQAPERGEEQPAPTEMATLCFVPVRKPRLRSEEMATKDEHDE